MIAALLSVQTGIVDVQFVKSTHPNDSVAASRVPSMLCVQ
jgi:hypothetical protein